MKKYAVTAAVLLPMLAAASAANAGAGVSDKRFFPDQARAAPTYKLEMSTPGAWRSVTSVKHKCEYRGGPKSPLIHSWQP
jgi:hypothetical protein